MSFFFRFEQDHLRIEYVAFTLMYGGPSLSRVFLASKQRSTSFCNEIINSVCVFILFYLRFSILNYFFKSQIDFKWFFNFKSNIILTLNFTNAYWERTSAITIKKKKKLNGPALSLHAVRPGTAACSCQS